jgi:hypothetical protein
VSFNKGPSIGEDDMKQYCNTSPGHDMNKGLPSGVSGIRLVNHKQYKEDAKINGSFLNGKDIMASMYQFHFCPSYPIPGRRRSSDGAVN